MGDSLGLDPSDVRGTKAPPQLHERHELNFYPTSEKMLEELLPSVITGSLLPVIRDWQQDGLHQ